MVRWLGIVLILISSGYWGIRKTAELRRRPRLLKAAADSLKLIRSDIAFRLLPLPDTLRHAAQAAPAPLRHVYAARRHGAPREAVCRPWSHVRTERGRHAILTQRRSKMDVDLVFKIAAIGILVAVLNILLSRAGRDEQALMTTIAGLVVVLVLVIEKISELFNLIKSLFAF